jgi:transposase-like protein
VKKRKRRGNYPKRRPSLGEIHYEAIALLATKRGANYEGIAKQLRISVRTLYRWRQRRDFDRALRVAIEKHVRETVGSRGYYRPTNADEIAYIFRISGLIS